MNSRRSLKLIRETLRTLSPARLGGVAGGSLVTVDDPITAPPTDKDSDETRRTGISCYCVSR